MLFVTNTTNIDVCIDERRKLMAKNKLTLQPFIITHGKDISDIKGPFIIVFDTIKYLFKSLCNAIEILIKIYRVFDLEWPKANYAVYMFLDEMFTNQNQISNHKVSELLRLVKSEEN